MLARLKFDLDNLVNEILDHLPQDLLIHGRVLDPAMGGGQFVQEVERRKRAAGLTDSEIANSVFGYEKNTLRKNYAVNKHKLVGSYQVCDFNNKDSKIMKPDVIVGNPPFQRTNNDAKRWTLWEEFFHKSWSQADTICLVVPQSATGPGAVFDKLKHHAKIINTDVSRHFSVGSTFCYFVATPNQVQSETQLITPTGTLTKQLGSLPFLPNNISEHTLQQLDQLLNRARREWRRGELHTSRQDLFDPAGQYTVMHTNAQTLHTNLDRPERNLIRVAVSLSGYPQFQVVQGGYCSQATFYTQFDTVDQAQAFADECNSESVQNILKNFKWSGWNSSEVISLL